MEFYLDWNKETLYGWEMEKSDKVIEKIIEGIQEGAEFSPVPVHQGEDGNYYLSYDPDEYLDLCCLDGGHNRAFAHYQAGEPLLCSLLEDVLSYEEIARQKYFDIRDTLIVPDDGEYEARKLTWV